MYFRQQTQRPSPSFFQVFARFFQNFIRIATIFTGLIFILYHSRFLAIRSALGTMPAPKALKYHY